MLAVAALTPATRALGPGVRACVWVQGCLQQCHGCIAPDWRPLHPAHLVPPQELVSMLLASPHSTGLTFSGGEPMLQAAGLAALARLSRQQRALSVVCFTGYPLEQLSQEPPAPGVSDLLAEVDVLIDGPYRAALNDDLGLRGSSNQRIHFLTNRIPLGRYDFAAGARNIEISMVENQVVLVGVPSHRALTALDEAMERVSRIAGSRINNGTK